MEDEEIKTRAEEEKEEEQEEDCDFTTGDGQEEEEEEDIESDLSMEDGEEEAAARPGGRRGVGGGGGGSAGELMAELSRVRLALRDSRRENAELRARVTLHEKLGAEAGVKMQWKASGSASSWKAVTLSGSGLQAAERGELNTSPVSSPSGKARDGGGDEGGESPGPRVLEKGEGEKGGGTFELEELDEEDPEVLALTEAQAKTQAEPAVNGDVVATELVQLAKDFPGCAQFLMNEFDTRRLLTESGHTVEEDRVRRIMSRVARKSKDSEVRLMAMYIGEKLGGGRGGGPGPVPMDLEVLPEGEREENKRLKRCTCPMTTSMMCACGGGGGGGGGGGEVRARVTVNKWRQATVRRQFGNVTVEMGDVERAVEEMGGVACVESKQGAKGQGWKAVAGRLGIDIDKNRDCGYQVRKIYMRSREERRRRAAVAGGGGGGGSTASLGESEVTAEGVGGVSWSTSEGAGERQSAS